MRTKLARVLAVALVMGVWLGIAAVGLGAEGAAPAAAPAAAEKEILPEALQFLHVGWFIVHLVAIPVVFIIGYVVGKKAAAK